MSEDNDFALKHETAALKSDWLCLQTNIEKLNQKSDPILGITYVTSEYDDFSKNVMKLKKQNQNLFQNINNLKGSMGTVY